MENILKKPRKIVLLSFDADLTLMLKVKQSIFPVFVITRGCLIDNDPSNHVDNRINTFSGALLWARFCDLQGVVCRYYQSLEQEYLNARNLDLKIFVYGDIPSTGEFLSLSKSRGLDGLIVDDVVERFTKHLFKLYD